MGTPRVGIKKIGKYAVLGELGKGGTGVVYRAIDPTLEREVAIKRQVVDAAENADKERYVGSSGQPGLHFLTQGRSLLPLRPSLESIACVGVIRPVCP